MDGRTLRRRGLGRWGSWTLLGRSLFILSLLVAYVLAFRAVEFDPANILQNLHHLRNLLGKMYPPDFSHFDQLIRPLIQTLQISFLGTLFGALLAIPLVAFGTQVVIRNPWIYWPIRSLMNLLRTVPDLVYAVLFVAAFGYDHGPLAGMVALSVFSCSIIAKLASESADNINRRPIEAIEATGASKFQVIRYAVIPQLLPAFIDHTIYVFELNVRVAAVMGYVGAGGIGQQLLTQLDLLKYDTVFAIILTIFALVVVIDFVGNRIRDALLHGLRMPFPVQVLTWVALGWTAVWSLLSLDVNPERVLIGLGYLKNLLWAIVSSPAMEFFNISISRMWESLLIAFVGTTLSFILAFPLGFLASRKYTGIPSQVAFWVKQIPGAIRAFPELILAIFFIASFGPGPLAGVLAIAIHSIGMLGKMNAEAVEKIRKEQVEALQATGANRAQVFRFGILPQVLPEFLALAIYRFEINVRASTVLGIVGAGGIGMLINEALSLRQWNIIGLCLLVIIPVVIAIDFISERIRRKLIEGSHSA
ncbi:phosphonate ABC transporter, permease protein PhnE [Candidatus Acetothermia bacterium]|nr:phosphonate ABC transporter, permease protein PhnE [Candidatus Acetothermia bacterium]